MAGRAADPGQDEAVTGLRARIEELLERVGRAEGELVAERRRSADMAAALATDREAARVMLAKAEARADRLEAALAEARRPWLTKVLEGLRRKGS